MRGMFPSGGDSSGREHAEDGEHGVLNQHGEHREHRVQNEPVEAGPFRPGTWIERTPSASTIGISGACARCSLDPRPRAARVNRLVSVISVCSVLIPPFLVRYSLASATRA